MRRLLLALALGTALPASAQTPAQAALDRLAGTMGYRFAILDNGLTPCPAGVAACFRSEITLTIPADLPPAVAAPELRFGFVSRVIGIDSEDFDWRLVNGDLNALTLKPGRRLEPGKTYRIGIIGLGRYLSRAHGMPNAHLVVAGAAPRVIAATRARIDPDTGLETLPFVAPMTDEAKLAQVSAEDRTRWLTPPRAYARYAERGAATAPDVVVLPKPVSAVRGTGAITDLTGGIRMTASGIAMADLRAALDALPYAKGRGVPVVITRKAGLKPEGYRLSIGEGRIAIDAADADGARHALRSLAQQAAQERGRLRPLIIEDAPRYPFRGLHIDLARNFHSRAEVEKLIEQMAAYKLNKLHLHLGDDEGWRMQIRALPELTDVGAYRCFDATETTCLQPQLGADPDRRAATNGYLSQADYLTILAAAKARGIEVIPSFDMPGHSRAAIRAMEVRHRRLQAAGDRAGAERYRLVEPGDTTAYRSIQNYDDNTLNVCIEGTYRFLDTVLDEMAALHAKAGMPLKTYHIGADETAGAWSRSPACRTIMAARKLEPKQLGAYFIERVSAGLARRGISAAGWSDGMGHTDAAAMPPRVQSNIWSGVHTGAIAEAHGQANRGWDIVLSVPDLAYFDMPYAPDPDEGGYDWASRGVDPLQVFGFMPGNLPANGALIPDNLARPTPVADTIPLAQGRAIAGLQAQLWSETLRTDTQVEYMLFPRLLSLAERAWSAAPWEPAYVPGATYALGDARVDRGVLLSEWRGFAGRVGVALGQLDRAGVAYRLAPPGARITAGRLEALSEFPGTTIEYRAGAGAWQRYTGPVAVSGPVELRTRSSDGRRPGRSVTVRPGDE
ncbi:beta-N-acetylhexosaminidase [Sphingomonas sp. Leaf407]|uniref:family 20 glycosylhydrolase n=1 Tax=unclassified Sphingomonas TaxID=196159 RepID=UPI0006FB1E43|nr:MULTISPECIES: family 20 glycosylhydrolase [unclassified Sphingomonas]KQN39469.1 beta-N-acetylhexosaminidase [Sphingomonas sp. Leaf42]KQT28745.1 beta-N-acetylhexosaminidase [Sphingomonas sp. Leaf407]